MRHPAAPDSARRRLQKLAVFWIAFVIFYTVARIPVGVIIGALGPVSVEINIGRTMSIPDAIVFFPLNHIWAFLMGHEKAVVAIGAVYWILFCVVWAGILLWVFFKWIHDTLRTFLEN